jgi:phosphatidylinositol kinase/protein kinase (PI-3  family)
MLRIDTNIEIMSSKEKPKKLLIFAADGKKYNFLCKMERKGDLRKDARLMEINSVVNRYVRPSWGIRFCSVPGLSMPSL